ncbi:MAG: MoaD/ThiS family protein [Anaerolineae bacterium]|nr:MoaD/ThiS family protein [Anaerolineae bacterium]MDW8172831.1 ubiquitin-like small modifier protein 1 [Anaerolineae bacterium]
MKHIKLFAMLRDIAGTKELIVPFTPGQTVRQLTQDIAAACPALGEKMLTPDGELSGLVHVLVHGRNVQWLQGLETPIREEDQITLIPPSAGG